jgi:hypothetical protein
MRVKSLNAKSKQTPASFNLMQLGLACCLSICVYLSAAFVPAHAQIFSSWFGDDDEQSEQADLLSEDAQAPEAESKTDQAKHTAAFGEIVYLYFQEEYQDVLQLIEVGNSTHQFALLDKDNKDRLNLMQGAAQLQLGLYKKSQAMFAQLLSETTSDYVQANTWFFMAKAGFANKQAYLTERAYAAINQNDADGDLREQLSDEQWYELLYITAYTRMQLEALAIEQAAPSSLADAFLAANPNAVDLQQNETSEPTETDPSSWQYLLAQIPTNNIYHAYLLANAATNDFNQANYDSATNTFTQAKQALLAYQNRRGFIREIATGVFDTVSWFVSPWTWFDENATAEQAALERDQEQDLAEQNALFDRINIGLGQSLLQQGDLENAIAVIQNISEQGGDAEQALLSYGWANARENRWQTAMAAWQYLQQNSVGLFSLQASYGLAYAFGQQDNLGQAFFALRNTSNQIDSSIVALDKFAGMAQQGDFFNEYNQKWPQDLRDLKLGFFAPTQSFDAQYLLSMRQQANAILKDIDKKSTRLGQLTQMLYEREQSYQNRSNSLSLANAESQIQQTQTIIDGLKGMLGQSDGFEQELSLSKRMANAQMSSHITRLDNAQGRLTRLQNDDTRKRPLKKSYAIRLKRLQGIATWDLMDTFVAKKWQHQQLLSQAQSALNQAEQQYERLLQIQQDKDAFKEQRARLYVMLNELDSQTAVAQNVYKDASTALLAHLLKLIDTRKTQLQQQSVNTRLAMLRIQDLRTNGGQ